MMSNEKEKSAFHARIYGRVQGVGFRYNTRQEAMRRNLSGWVRNLSNGSVEVVCEGEAPQVKAFAGWLEKGPPGAGVSNVDFQTVPYKGTYSRFTVEF